MANADGTVSYTPGAGFTGTDSFTYTVKDTATGTQTSNAATVTVNVAAVQPPPPPTTDTVTITKASLAKNGNLSASGSVSRFNAQFGAVEVWQGTLSNGNCTGTDLGAASVNARNGGWSFSKKGVAQTPRVVCAKSSNGGAAQLSIP